MGRAVFRRRAAVLFTLESIIVQRLLVRPALPPALRATMGLHFTPARSGLRRLSQHHVRPVWGDRGGALRLRAATRRHWLSAAALALAAAVRDRLLGVHIWVVRPAACGAPLGGARRKRTD